MSVAHAHAHAHAHAPRDVDRDREHAHARVHTPAPPREHHDVDGARAEARTGASAAAAAPAPAPAGATALASVLRTTPLPRIEYERIVLEEVIGDGSFSVVYRAALRGHGAVAVKLFRRTAGKADPRESFARELALAASYDSDCVVRVLGYCEQPLCIVMELVDGACLFDLLHNRAFLFCWSQYASIALGVARSLTHVHERGVMHRDVKSLNVLISDAWEVKLCDFGLGRETDTLPVRPATGGRGTPQYMAPEVILHQPYDVRADIFSFGMMLWEMASRQVPFDGMAAVHAAAAVAYRAYRPPIPPYAPPRVARLIAACWAQDAAARPTAVEIVRFLTRKDLVPLPMQGDPVPFLTGAPIAVVHPTGALRDVPLDSAVSAPSPLAASAVAASCAVERAPASGAEGGESVPWPTPSPLIIDSPSTMNARGREPSPAVVDEPLQGSGTGASEQASAAAQHAWTLLGVEATEARAHHRLVLPPARAQPAPLPLRPALPRPPAGAQKIAGADTAGASIAAPASAESNVRGSPSPSSSLSSSSSSPASSSSSYTYTTPQRPMSARDFAALEHNAAVVDAELVRYDSRVHSAMHTGGEASRAGSRSRTASPVGGSGARRSRAHVRRPSVVRQRATRTAPLTAAVVEAPVAAVAVSSSSADNGSSAQRTLARASSSRASHGGAQASGSHAAFSVTSDARSDDAFAISVVSFASTHEQSPALPGMVPSPTHARGSASVIAPVTGAVRATLEWQPELLHALAVTSAPATPARRVRSDAELRSV